MNGNTSKKKLLNIIYVFLFTVLLSETFLILRIGERNG
jgi:hypothetical protein